MGSSVCNATKKEETKAKLIEYMEQNDIAYNLLECCNCDRICIDFTKEKSCEKHCCHSGIIVSACNKDVYRIHPYEILYIAIENRKSVLYLTKGKVETNHLLDYWKKILDQKMFAQPHNSFLVNLRYVESITKDFVNIKYADKQWSVYTSMRKIGPFKKALLEFQENW